MASFKFHFAGLKFVCPGYIIRRVLRKFGRCLWSCGINLAPSPWQCTWLSMTTKTSVWHICTVVWLQWKTFKTYMGSAGVKTCVAFKPHTTSPSLKKTWFTCFQLVSLLITGLLGQPRAVHILYAYDHEYYTVFPSFKPKAWYSITSILSSSSAYLRCL